MSRELEAVLFEAEYLRALLNDGRELLDLIGQAADTLAGSQHNVIALLPAAAVGAMGDDLLAIAKADADVMAKLLELERVVARAGDTLSGRLAVLVREAGGELEGVD